MQISWILILVSFVMLAGLGAWLLGRNRKRTQSIHPEPPAVQTATPEETSGSISIGKNPDHPMVTVSRVQSPQAYEQAAPLDALKGGKFYLSQLSQFCQALPAQLIASQSHGKHLMEVVIHGDLVRAADGNGLRAFSKSGGRIREQARLFESNLQSAINAAAIWQVASVIVAQKHLADINQKLEELKAGIGAISGFLDNQRKARLHAISEYLEQVYLAIQAGDLPEAARTQLEQCEQDLLEIHHHLETEFRQKVDNRVKPQDTFGTAALTSDLVTKISDLDQVAEDIAFCTKARIAAWHVLALFPGEPQLKRARRQSIEKSIESFQALGPYCEQVVNAEIAEIYSFWNREQTLEERKHLLTQQCNSTVLTLNQKARRSREGLQQSDRLLQTNDRPMRLFLEFENGQLCGARQE